MPQVRADRVRGAGDDLRATASPQPAPGDTAADTLMAADIKRFLERPIAPITLPSLPDAPPGAPIGDPAWTGSPPVGGAPGMTEDCRLKIEDSMAHDDCRLAINANRHSAIAIRESHLQSAIVNGFLHQDQQAVRPADPVRRRVVPAQSRRESRSCRAQRVRQDHALPHDRRRGSARRGRRLRPQEAHHRLLPAGRRGDERAARCSTRRSPAAAASARCITSSRR